jgi:hypothetical protein
MVGELCRSQSLHSTEAAKVARGAKSKAAPREGRQEGGSVKTPTGADLSVASTRKG